MQGLPFKTITDIGMPWHGLATNNTLTTTSAGDKTVGNDALSKAAQIVGGCVPVRHPAAPGANRNAAQQAHDAANGLEWRDYALLCGPGRHVNGAPDAELGTLQFLYCDASGPTWVIRLEATPAGSSITFDVWLEAIFGRIGRERSFTPRKLATYVFTPDVPTWYTGGYTAADVVAEIDLNWINTLAFNPAGSQCFVNIFCRDDSINEDVYPETTPCGIKGNFNVSTALVGVLKIDIAGAGDLDNDGNGITATCVLDLAFEGGLVTNRTTGTDPGATWSGFPCDYVNVTSGPACPAPLPLDCSNPTQVPYVRTTSGTLEPDAVGSNNGNSVAYDAILYRSPDGDVVREFDVFDLRHDWAVTVSGAYTETWTLTNCPGFFHFCDDWWATSGSPVVGGSAVKADYETNFRDGTRIKVTAFGEVVVDIDYERVVNRIGCWSCAWITGATQTCTGPPYWNEITSATINGQATPGTNFYLRHEVRQLAQNLHYAVDYHSRPADEANHDLNESVVGITDQGVASVIWSATRQDTYRPPNQSTYDLPQLLNLVWSYQPVTGDETHGQLTLGVNYSGDVWQYC